MRWDLIPYLLPLVAAATLSGALAVIAWLHRRTPGAAALMAIMLAVAEWALAYALELSADDLPSKVFWSGVAYTGLLVIPSAWLLLAARFTGRGIPGRGTLAALLVEPLLVLLCLWTEGAHGLVGTAFRLRTVGAVMTLDMTPGPVFWLNALYSYALLLTGVLVAGAWLPVPADGRKGARGKLVLLLVGAGAPVVGSALLAAGSNPPLQFEPTPFAFALCGLALAWDMFAPRQWVRLATHPAFAPPADTLAVIADVDLPRGRDLAKPLGVAETWPVPPAATPAPAPALAAGAAGASAVAGPLTRDLRITLHDREGTPIGRLVVLESAAALQLAGVVWTAVLLIALTICALVLLVLRVAVFPVYERLVTTIFLGALFFFHGVVLALPMVLFAARFAAANRGIAYGTIVSSTINVLRGPIRIPLRARRAWAPARRWRWRSS